MLKIAKDVLEDWDASICFCGCFTESVEADSYFKQAGIN